MSNNKHRHKKERKGQTVKISPQNAPVGRAVLKPCLEIWVEKCLWLECDVLITKLRGGVGAKLLAPNPPSSMKTSTQNSPTTAKTRILSTMHYVLIPLMNTRFHEKLEDYSLLFYFE